MLEVGNRGPKPEEFTQSCRCQSLALPKSLPCLRKQTGSWGLGAKCEGTPLNPLPGNAGGHSGPDW